MSTTKTILYVEDSAFNTLLVKAILGTRTDLQILSAVTAAEGLALAHQRIDLLLLDLNLPDMRGEAFLKQFRAIPGFECVPAIIISGEAISDHADKFNGLGVAGVLIKPFDIDQFEKLVDQHIPK